MSQSEAFTALFRRFEHALKRGDFLARKQRAEADWQAFAESLGPEFFEEVRHSNKAPTLIQEPPRRLMADLTWRPDVPAPIENVVDLFKRGVCQVRNNLFHGEKYIGSPDAQSRDEALVSESLWILRLASEKAPKMKL